MPSFGPEKNPPIAFHKQWWFWFTLVIVVGMGLLQLANKYGLLPR